MEHHTATVKDVRLHYVRAGEGDPVVLLHGWPQTWWEWRHVIPQLAETNTVIVPDLRGLGASSKPDSGYDTDNVAAVLKNMGDNQVRRLPVVDRNKRLVGVVSLGDLSRAAHEKASGSALKEISEKPVEVAGNGNGGRRRARGQGKEAGPAGA